MKSRWSDASLVAIVIAVVTIGGSALSIVSRNARMRAASETRQARDGAALQQGERAGARRGAWLEPETAGDGRDGYARALAACDIDQALAALHASECSAVATAETVEGPARASALSRKIVESGYDRLRERKDMEAAQRWLGGVWLGIDLGRSGGTQSCMTGLAASAPALMALRDAIAQGMDTGAIETITTGLDRAARERRSLADAYEAESMLTTSRLLAAAREASLLPLPWAGPSRQDLLLASGRVAGHIGMLQDAARRLGHCSLATSTSADDDWVRLQGKQSYFPLVSKKYVPVLWEEARGLALLRGVRLQARLVAWRRAQGRYPAALAELDLSGQAAEWADAYSYDRNTCEQAAFTYRADPPLLSSAGVDGQAGTPDDMNFPLPESP